MTTKEHYQRYRRYIKTRLKRIYLLTIVGFLGVCGLLSGQTPYDTWGFYILTITIFIEGLFSVYEGWLSYHAQYSVYISMYNPHQRTYRGKKAQIAAISKAFWSFTFAILLNAWLIFQYIQMSAGGS